MVDIAAKIAASQKKMKEKQEAELKQEEADRQQNFFSRAISAPQMAATPAAHGATLTIFDAVKMGDVRTSSIALLPCNSLLSGRL